MIVTLLARDIALHHTHSCIRISFQSSFSIDTCFRSLVFCSSFLLFYSSFFVYFFASPDQRNICKFTLCCDFQLVHQSHRNIVILYFLCFLFIIVRGSPIPLSKTVSRISIWPFHASRKNKKNSFTFTEKKQAITFHVKMHILFTFRKHTNTITTRVL